MRINRADRNKAVQMLRRYVAGRISDDELLDKWPRTEPTLKALYDDCIFQITEHVAWVRKGAKPKLSREAKDALARTILFLNSDEEYLWPRPSPLWKWVYSFAALGAVGIGLKTDWEWAVLFLGTFAVGAGSVFGYFTQRQFKRAGEWGTWPFFKAPDFQNAKARPRYLTGNKTSAG